LTETDDANVWLNSAIDGVILASNDLYAQMKEMDFNVKMAK
jgi:hypothetical protein